MEKGGLKDGVGGSDEVGEEFGHRGRRIICIRDGTNVKDGDRTVGRPLRPMLNWMVVSGHGRRRWGGGGIDTERLLKVAEVWEQ